MVHFDVRHLELVEAIADTGTLTRAADRLHVTQSALSHQLGDIERRLRTQLFLRVNRRLVLSPAGERLLSTARRVLTELRNAEGDIARLARNQAGSIRISMQCYTCYHWFPPLLKTFRRTFPDVEVEIVPEASRRIPEALAERQIDVGLTYAAVRDRRIEHTALFTDELFVVVAPDHPLAKRKILAPADIAGEIVILHNAPEHSLFAQHLTQAGVHPRRYLQMNLTEAILEMVAAGLGVTALPLWTLPADRMAKKFVTVRLSRGGLRRRWSAARLRTNAPDAAQEHLIGLIAGRWT